MPVFLAVTFTLSWALWLTGIKAGVREPLLLFGVAGPAFAAAFMSLRSKELSFSLPLFLALAPISWAILAAAYGPDPLLILPALLPAASAAVFIRWTDIQPLKLRWPLIAAFSMPAILLIPASIARFAGLPLVYPRRGEALLITAAATVTLFAKHLLFAGLLEEPGWRGWLLPRLQRKHSSLVSSLLVWFPWALWHVPLDFTGSVGRTWLNYIQVRVVFFIAITIILTWLYNRSGGSILVTGLFHAGMNTFPFVLPYSPPLLALIFVWAGWAVFADRMWRFRGPRNGAMHLDLPQPPASVSAQTGLAEN